MSSPNRDRFFKAFLLLVTCAIGLGAAELALRVKNISMKNYPIEMWRYAKELKIRSGDPILGHEHVTSKCAILQGVEICLNELGLRGKSLASSPRHPRRILFLGNSVALGWGVPEKETLSARVEEKFRNRGETVDVWNAGIGNYNTERYVELFFTKLLSLQPTDIVVEYFPRDAEKLEAGGGNWILRHSELAVMMETFFSSAFHRSGFDSVDEEYLKAHQPNSPGFVAMQAALQRLSQYGHAHGTRLFLAMVPDVHRLNDYKLSSIHETMRTLSSRLGFAFVDLYPSLSSQTPTEIWNMPGDPHPNGLANAKMAERLFPALADAI